MKLMLSKKIKYLSVMLMMLALFFILSSCTTPKTTYKWLINTPDKISYQTGDVINKAGSLAVSFRVAKSKINDENPRGFENTIVEPKDLVFTKISDEDPTQSYSIITYSFKIENVSQTFDTVFFNDDVPSTLSSNTVVLLDVRYKAAEDAKAAPLNGKYKKNYGYAVLKEDLEVRAVYADKRVEIVDADAYDLSYSEIYKKNIVNGGIYDIIVTYKDKTASTIANCEGGNKPIKLFDIGLGIIDFLFVGPVAWIANLFSFGGILFLSIALTTIFVRTLAWPIYTNSFSTMNRMQEIVPLQAKIQEKYRGRTDAQSKNQMNLEMQAMMKKNKINLWGCVALQLLQMGVFSLMWQVITRIAIPNGSFSSNITAVKFLGIDLTVGANSWTWDHILLIALMSGTQILYTLVSQTKPKWKKQTTSNYKSAVPNPNNPMSKMSPKATKIFTVVLTTGMFIFFSFGQINTMAFYWIVGNLFSLAQILIQRQIDKRVYLKKEREKELGGF